MDQNGMWIPGWFCLILLLFIRLVIADEKHEGLYIGKFNTYAHQITGHVYAIDEYTIFIKSFFYDGLGQDAFFWAGSTIRPSNVGFIVPDEEGKTNKLQPYTDKDIIIKLPDRRKITSIKWLSIWNIRDNANYGDIYFPEGFEPPSPKRISELSRRGGGVRSGTVVILDSKSISIPEFYFDGNNTDTYFWVGYGAQPSSAGEKIPNEKGYLEPLPKYQGEHVILTLPGDKTVFDIDWLSVWNVAKGENYGSVIIPHGQDIPPSQLVLFKHESRLPNCEQLHRNLQLRWEIQGRTLSLELTGQIDEDDYMAFGISGSKNSSQMINADAAVALIDGHYGNVVDYNITNKFVCSNVLGRHKGVCPDLKVGGKESYQILTFTRKDGLTSIIYRRTLLTPDDDGDKEYKREGDTYVVWAIGKFNKFKEPTFHHTYPKGNVKVQFGRKTPENNCFDFTRPKVKRRTATWGPLRIKDKVIDTFIARIGPAGGKRGYTGITGLPSPGVAWYINGILAPDIFVKRGKQYIFKVEGGNNPHNTRYYHPFYITDNPYGGYGLVTEEEKTSEKIYAGIDFDRRGRPQPTAAGRLCAWEYNMTEPRKADEYSTFPKFRGALQLQCDEGGPAILRWTPNASTPDLVYYQSYTTRNMGWRIFVLDELTTGNGFSHQPALTLMVSCIITVFIVCTEILKS